MTIGLVAIANGSLTQFFIQRVTVFWKKRKTI
jgi:hypothetical protein